MYQATNQPSPLPPLPFAAIKTITTLVAFMGGGPGGARFSSQPGADKERQVSITAVDPSAGWGANEAEEDASADHRRVSRREIHSARGPLG